MDFVTIDARPGEDAVDLLRAELLMSYVRDDGRPAVWAGLGWTPGTEGEGEGEGETRQGSDGGQCAEGRAGNELVHDRKRVGRGPKEAGRIVQGRQFRAVV